jgi:hypothetical protein
MIQSEIKKLMFGLIADADQDALAFGKIVDIGKVKFKLKGKNLYDFVESIITQLLSINMQVVIPAPVNSKLLWVKHPDYILPINEVVSKLLNQWNTIGDYDFMVWYIPCQNLDDRKPSQEGE